MFGNADDGNSTDFETWISKSKAVEEWLVVALDPPKYGVYIIIFLLSQWTLKKQFGLYFSYWIWNPKKLKRLGIG